MTTPYTPPATAPVDPQYGQAFDDGRRAGLAIAALSLSLVAFLNLLGTEKAILAIILALIARRGSRRGLVSGRLAAAAIGIASAFIVSMALVLFFFWNELVGLVNYLWQLS